MDTVQFVIRRKTAFSCALLPYRIYINGQYVGTLRNGGALVVNVPRANAYYIEDDVFSECNALISDKGQAKYGIVIKTSGGWHSAPSREFYLEGNCGLEQTKALHYNKLYQLFFERRTNELSPEDRTLALCIMFFRCIDELQELLSSDELLSITAALRRIGADKYAHTLQSLVQKDFSDVELPLNDEYSDKLQDRIEAASKAFDTDKIALDELHKAFVHYLIDNIDKTTFVF